jgi:hypothetical protein
LEKIGLVLALSDKQSTYCGYERAFVTDGELFAGRHFE